MAEERQIRKYANRRLYDAQDSRHVTLEDRVFKFALQISDFLFSTDR